MTDRAMRAYEGTPAYHAGYMLGKIDALDEITEEALRIVRENNVEAFEAITIAFKTVLNRTNKEFDKKNER